MSSANGEVACAIDALLAERDADASICPSEVARRLWPDHWRAHMTTVREVATAQMQAGLLLITQRGKAVDLSLPLRGAIRLRKPSGRT